MILDKQNLMSDDQALTASVASTNVIDLGDDTSKVKALNEKGDLEVFAQVTTAFSGGTSVKATLQSDDDEAFGSPTTLIETAAIAVADLVAGYGFRFKGLPEINERYLRMYFTVVGTPTAGKVTAGLALQRQTSG